MLKHALFLIPSSLLVLGLPTLAWGIDLEKPLALGECKETNDNGSPVKVCRDRNGTYNILPATTPPDTSSEESKSFLSQPVSHVAAKPDIELLALAEHGDADAQNKVGVIYYKGEEVTQDYAEGLKWFRKSADQGFAKAQYNVGQTYHQGQGVQQSDVEAIKFYRLAAAQGYAPAQVSLGVMYHEGLGVNQSRPDAVKWWKDAALQGNADAQCKLGSAYLAGEGVPKDEGAGLIWIQKAAAQQNPEAQNILGLINAKKEAEEAEKEEASRQRAEEVKNALYVVLGFFTVIFCICVYLLPAIVAEKRKHHNTLAIFVFNLLLGWTFLGWVLALVWACTTTKTAPIMDV